jgi:hypothetical protein
MSAYKYKNRAYTDKKEQIEKKQQKRAMIRFEIAIKKNFRKPLNF